MTMTPTPAIVPSHEEGGGLCALAAAPRNTAAQSIMERERRAIGSTSSTQFQARGHPDVRRLRVARRAARRRAGAGALAFDVPAVGVGRIAARVHRAGGGGRVEAGVRPLSRGDALR